MPCSSQFYGITEAMATQRVLGPFIEKARCRSETWKAKKAVESDPYARDGCGSTKVLDGNGDTVGGIRSWFVCQGRTGWNDTTSLVAPCLRLLGSNDDNSRWLMKLSDPAASGQRLYCSCLSKYKASWGMLVEIFCVDSSFPVQIVTRFMKAEVPCFSVGQICIMQNSKRGALH